jgi:D-lactate dehydrogenase (cytochrome)
MDGRCLALLREEGLDRASAVSIPPHAEVALLVTLDLPPGTTPGQAFDEIGVSKDTSAPDTPLVRFCRMLADAGVIDDVEIAVPGDAARAVQLLSVRESVPAAVNQRVSRAKHSIDPRIEKMAGDLLVPFDRVSEFLDICEATFRQRGLDAAIWGHISDGNVHPNVIPRSLADVEQGREAILLLGREAVRLGGVPLAEHGVGRNPVKQQLLKDLYGEEGIEDMRRVKRAIDPDWKLAPGVLFSRY